MNNAPYQLEFCTLPDVRPWLDRIEECPFMSKEELAAFGRRKTPKRRLDWLAGRLAAKRLLQRILKAQGIYLSLTDIHVFNEKSGKPYVQLAPAEPVSGLSALPVEQYPISISHTRDFAVCALSAPGTHIGADLESVDPKDPAWLDVAFHKSEIAYTLREDHMTQMNLWTLKEAILKFLGTGLSVDLWDIRCLPGEGVHATRLELHGKARQAWEKLGSPEIAFDTIPYGNNKVLSVAYTPGPSPL